MSRHLGRLVRRMYGASIALAVTLASHAFADTPPFEIEILPPLETSEGALPNVLGHEINDSGQVVGRAQGLGVAAFRFTPDVGMENLDPNGDLDSDGRHISTSGAVFGEAAGFEPFLYADETGFDLIPERPEDFIAFELNDREELIGSTVTGRPFIYSSDAGWLDLSDVSPLFQDNPTVAKLINYAGDLVFTVNRPPGTQESFVLLNGRRFVDLGDFGFPMNVPAAIDRVGRVVGLADKNTGPNASFASRSERQSRAYYYSPRHGVVDIHPSRFEDSFAGWIQSKGKTAGGAMAKRRHDRFDTIFTYHPVRGLEIQAKRHDFARFVRRRGGKFKDLSITDMNDRLEFVGSLRSSVKFRQGGSTAAYLLRSGDGLIGIQDIVDETGVQAAVKGVADINNLGQILIQIELPDGRASAAILTPPDANEGVDDHIPLF